MSKLPLLLVCLYLLVGGVAWGQRAVVPTMATGYYRLRPGIAVVGSYPAGLPAHAFEQLDFSLVSHLCYGSYRATGQGRLEPVVAPAASTLAAVRHQNPGCKVLLSVLYQPATPGLLGAAPARARQDLAEAIVHLLATTKATGVNLEFAFRPTPKPRSVATPLSPALSQPLAAHDWQLIKAQLKQRRLALNKDSSRIQHDTIRLQQQLQAAHAGSAPIGYAARLQAQRRLAVEFRLRRAVFRIDQRAFKNGLVPPTFVRATRPAPAATAAAYATELREFVVLLHERMTRRLPGSNLVLTLPAVDATRTYAQLVGLASAVQLFVVPTHDYPASQPNSPEPLASLHPEFRWDSAAVAASVAYYEKAGVPAAKLVVAFPHSSKSSKEPAAASDPAGLAIKYAWVIRHRLGGVGIGDLNYEAPAALAAQLRRAGLLTPTTPTSTTPARIALAEPRLQLPAWGQAALFAAALLLGFVLLGVLISALLQAPAIIPFRNRLLKVGLLLGGGLSLLMAYGYFLGPHNGQSLLFGCPAGLALLGLGTTYHRFRQPKELP